MWAAARWPSFSPPFYYRRRVLSLNISNLTAKGGLLPLLRFAQSLSCHILFADDILLFFQAIPLGATRLSKLPTLYQDSPGQLFNLSKSLLFLDKVNLRAHRSIKNHLKVPMAKFPSKYLGAPLFLGSSKKEHFALLVAAFSKKLSGWRSKLLSFAGRLILVKHALSSMAVHAAMAFPIPKSVCHSFEKIMRNFLWSGSDEKRKVYFVSCSKICLPKQEGGLGLHWMADFN